MRKLMIAFVAALVLSGCSPVVVGSAASADALPIATPVPITSPPGMVPGDVPPPAGTTPPVLRPALRLYYDGPAARNVRVGQQDNVVFAFRLEALDDVEIRASRHRLVSDASERSFVGSLESVYFHDIKWKDLETGQTLMGPTSISAPTTNSVFWEVRDAFAMRRGEVRRLGITMDIASREDVPGELVGRSYRISFTDEQGARFFRPSDVRRISDGTFVLPEEIVGNEIAEGNPFTVVAPTLNVALAATPMRTETVKKANRAPVTGIVFTASAASDLQVRETTLSAMGNINGFFLPYNAWHVATSCALFDGNVEVGLAQSPDSMGRIRITAMNWSIPRGTSRTLEVRCTMDSVVSQLTGGDRLSIGIARPSDVIAFDDSELTASVNLASGVIANASAAPVDFVTVHDRGTLSIEIDPSASVTPGFWIGRPPMYVVANYIARSTLEPAVIDRLRIQLTGHASFVNRIYVVDGDGATHGQDTFPAGENQARDIDLTANTINVFPGRPVRIQIRAMPAHSWPAELPAGAYSVEFNIAHGYVQGEWDLNYMSGMPGVLNIRTSGAVSGDRIYAINPCGLRSCPSMAIPVIAQ